jgi:hypothetical protein
MTRYQSCIAVRSNDPLAERDIVNSPRPDRAAEPRGQTIPCVWRMRRRVSARKSRLRP